MIQQATVDKIVDAANITEVVGDFISLKKRGVNYLGMCPFHNEKTPSFIVSPAKGIYKCFGCGKAGNSVNFIMEHEHMSYPEALRFLAKKYHIPVEEKEQTQEEKARNTERESMMIVSSYAQKYFSDYLMNNEKGIAIGLSYLKQRGITQKSIETFELGFCPDGKTEFTDAAVRNGYNLDYLVKSGLTIQRDNWKVDRFQGRVMFPIHNVSGRVCAFGGRTLSNDKKTAKYLNSPESEIYHKSRILYGIYQAKREIIKQDKAFLVEGYTDVISLHQSGIENVVASSGTALTPDQVRLVKRFTPNITLIYDGDPAGIKASLRGTDIILEEGMNVKIVTLPDGHDPDSFAKSLSASEFNDYISENEIDFIKFKTQILLEEAKKDPIKRAQLITDIVKTISVVPDKILRSVYIKETSDFLDTKEDILYQELNKLLKQNISKNAKQQLSQSQTQHTTTPPVASTTSNPNLPPPDLFNEPAEELKTPLNTTSPATEEAPKALLPATQSPVDKDIYVVEKEIVWVLLNYGAQEIYVNDREENTTVGRLIIREIEQDELTFLNPLYKRIYEEFKVYTELETKELTKVFVNHHDPKVSQMAAELLNSPHFISKFWMRDGKIVRTEEIDPASAIYKIIHEFKTRVLLKRIVELDLEIKNAEKEDNFDKVIQLLGIRQNLNTIKVELAKQAGEKIII